jgi:hypothetical protein
MVRGPPAPFSQDPMIGNYHTQVKVTVPYISTLQLPCVVVLSRTFEMNACAMRRSACVGIIQSPTTQKFKKIFVFKTNSVKIF